jgi:hypothetical protein
MIHVDGPGLARLLLATEAAPWRFLVVDAPEAVAAEELGFLDVAASDTTDTTARRFKIVRAEDAPEDDALRAFYLVPVCERCRARGVDAAPLAVALVVDFQKVERARWKELLAKAPPALWALVALTRDGASEEAVRAANDAIVARTDLTPGRQADHLVVLWFVAEAEDVPVRLMKEHITREKLMASTLYQSIFKDGEAQGETRGEAAHCAKTIVRILTRRVGELDPGVVARIRAVKSLDTLEVWLNEALDSPDDESARRLIAKIAKPAAA